MAANLDPPVDPTRDHVRGSDDAGVTVVEYGDFEGEQGRFWEMHDRLFEHQRALDHADLLRHAQEIGLDVERFAAALEHHSGRDRVEADVASGLRSGVEGTPALYIGGVRYDGFYDVESLQEAVGGQAA